MAHIITQEELTTRLTKNGWTWHSISNITPGVIRIQMGDNNEEETMWRRCIEAPTLEEAVSKAETLVNGMSAEEYYNNHVR